MESADQTRARGVIHARLAAGERSTVLAGAAGTGKTTLLRTLAEDLRSAGRGVVQLAPTGKAAAVLRERSGMPAQTVHRAVYNSVVEDADGDPVFGSPGPPCSPGDVVLVDEASMLGKELHDVLLAHLPPGAQAVFSGDREQLQPVNDEWGADLLRPHALLEEVHRQALESPVIRLATAVRGASPGWTWSQVGRGCWGEPGLERRRARPADAARWLAERRARAEDALLLTWRNKTRADLNARTRRARGIEGEWPQPGDRLLCLLNSYPLGVMNGEVREVRAAVRPEGAPWPAAGVDALGDGTLAWVRPDLANGRDTDEQRDMFRAFREHQRDLRRRFRREDGSDPAARWLHADGGECLTVHKSQGSEARFVAYYEERAVSWMAYNDPEGHRRLTYTAITRAREGFLLLEGA